VIPRGVRFAVDLPDADSAEQGGARLRLRELRRAVPPARPRPIGSNGLANPRDFSHRWRPTRRSRRRLRDRRQIPRALVVGTHRSLAARRRRLARQLHALPNRPAPLQHESARSATTTPIRRSSSCCSRSPTPPAWTQSISRSSAAHPRDGKHLPPALVPSQHRQRIMGLVHGAYDAKQQGFVPGGSSLHNCMTAHGPDAETFEKACAADTTKPNYIRDTMAIMFETRLPIRPTRRRLDAPQRPARLHRLLERPCAGTSTAGDAERRARRRWRRTTDRLDETHNPGAAQLGGVLPTSHRPTSRSVPAVRRFPPARQQRTLARRRGRSATASST